MSNDSTTRGYLTPVGDGPAYDDALEQEINWWISGVAGLPAEQVLPLWNAPQPPAQPDGTTWCEFSIAAVPRPLSQSDVQVSDEQSEQWTWEEIAVSCSFYGPLSATTSANFRAGMFIEQNNAELNLSGLSLVDAGAIKSLPELIDNQRVRRYDLSVTLSRKNTRTYNIRTLKSASTHYFGE